jgi:hypothetical protein
MSFYPSTIARCQHVKVNGTLCGSPALHRRRFCFFHQQWREQRIKINARASRRARNLDLPVLEDANSIQITLMQVMRLILAGQIDPKTAGLLLYALQTAAVNLKNTDFEPRTRENCVIDPRAVGNAILGENLWEREDFEEEELEDTEEQDEVEAEANATGEAASASAAENTGAEADEAEDEDDDGNESDLAAANDPAARAGSRPALDPHYNHPIRIALRNHAGFRAAVAESFSIEPDDPWLETMGPGALDDKTLKDICSRIGVSLAPCRRE